jgi:diguanylate cyclase (GGDEF)-like protein
VDGSSTRVAVVVNRIHDYQIPVVRGLESVAGAAGASLLVVVSQPQGSGACTLVERLVRTGRVHGVVVTSMFHPRTKLDRVGEVVRQAAGVPAVTMGVKVPGVPEVLCDNADAVRAALGHLLDGAGCRRPLHLTGPPLNQDSHEREVAFRAAAGERGLDLSPQAVVRGDFERETAYRQMVGRLRAGADFDAVLAANDAMALGALDALRERGLRVPEDVAVVGFDDTPGGHRADPPLTSVDQHLQEQGEVAARLLLDQLAGRAVPEEVRLGGDLVVRASSAPAGATGTASVPDQALAADSRQPEPAAEAALLRLELQREREEAGARRERDHEELDVTQHVLEMNRQLSACRSLDDLTGEVTAYLPRLRVDRCFLVLLDAESAERAGRSGPVPADVPLRARLVLSYRGGIAEAHPDGEPFALGELLPASLAGELDRGTLTVQPLSVGDQLFGLLLHEQATPDRHTGEALRLDTSRALAAIERARQLAERAAELEALVAERTGQLEREVATRRAAQEGLRTANEELRRALLRDGLTGLHNRPSFDEQLDRAWARSRRSGSPLSVLMCDVDDFKRYNDTRGHLAGDECLRRIASCLGAAVDRGEDVVARFGGEEFALVLPDTDAAGARVVAERVLQRVRDAALPHAGTGVGRRVSVSVGVATTGSVRSAEELVGAADAALYAAKVAGRDTARVHGAG